MAIVTAAAETGGATATAASSDASTTLVAVTAPIMAVGGTMMTIANPANAGGAWTMLTSAMKT